MDLPFVTEGQMAGSSRKSQIHRRQVRRRKLKALRTRYAAAKSESERNRVMQKTKRLRPAPSETQFLDPIKKT